MCMYTNKNRLEMIEDIYIWLVWMNVPLEEVSDSVRIQYGGSVNDKNAKDLGAFVAPERLYL